MKNKVFTPRFAEIKNNHWFAIAFLGLIVFTMGCSTTSTNQIEVGEIDISSPGQASSIISLDKITSSITPYNRLIKKGFTYQYNQSEIISFPLQPGKYLYYLVVTAEATPADSATSGTHCKLYCELMQKETKLFFIPSNFQQSCSSSACSNCKLIMYQNGSFGCECHCSETESSSTCIYEKSRVLTKKQQKSDII